MFFQYTTSITKARGAMNYIFRLRRQRVLYDIEESDNGDSESTNKTLVPSEETGSIEMGSLSVEKMALPAEKISGPAVDCNDITFAYPLRPALKVLRGIEVSIAPGSMVAFVGASGCGKSTMIALLQRFYDPVSGSITINNKDIRNIDRHLHRRSIALVQQEPVLYQGSIRENISLGVEIGTPTDAELEIACRQANVWEFISSLPEGLSTPCGNQGLSLSGGQRQRIAIARALIRSPRLLLLDEATSALDTESEKVVKEALDRAAEGRTTVAVAHRLSTIRDADVIVVFARGKVVQAGTHEELVAKRGVYYEMVLGQSLDREA